jgi:hypothetical protein
MTVCERVFRDLKFELPSTPVKRFVATRELVEHPSAALAQLLAEHEKEQHVVMRQLVQEFAVRFQREHGLNIRFTDDAAEWLVEQAQAQQVSVRELCAARFKDFQFGLKLVAQNTGQEEFVIDRATAESPARALSDWVVASYRK